MLCKSGYRIEQNWGLKKAMNDSLFLTVLASLPQIVLAGHPVAHLLRPPRVQQPLVTRPRWCQLWAVWVWVCVMCLPPGGHFLINVPHPQPEEDRFPESKLGQIMHSDLNRLLIMLQMSLSDILPCRWDYNNDYVYIGPAYVEWKINKMVIVR